MARAILFCWFGVVAVGASYLHGQAAQPSNVPAARRLSTAVSQAPASSPAAPTDVPIQPVLNKYCVTCHNGRLKTAGLMLDTMDVSHVGNAAEDQILR